MRLSSFALVAVFALAGGTVATAAAPPDPVDIHPAAVALDAFDVQAVDVATIAPMTCADIDTLEVALAGPVEVCNADADREAYAAITRPAPDVPAPRAVVRRASAWPPAPDPDPAPNVATRLRLYAVGHVMIRTPGHRGGSGRFTGHDC